MTREKEVLGIECKPATCVDNVVQTTQSRHKKQADSF